MKSVFDMTQEELDEQLRPAMEAAVARRFAKNLPVSYRYERCPTTAHFIHEYKDGSQFLVLQEENSLTSREIMRLV